MNGLDISLQGGYLYITDMKQPLRLENYFYIYKWKKKDMDFVLYTHEELVKIHRGFGHPTVKATHNLLERANKGKLSGPVLDEINKIKESDL